MDMWIDLAKEIMVYLLLYQIVMNMVQNTSYQKYVGIFLGTILICIIATPIFKLFKMENIWNIKYEKSEYLFEQKEMEMWLNSVEEMQEEMVLEEYRQKIKERTETILSKNQVEAEQIDVEIENENFQVKKIEIQLKNNDRMIWNREEQIDAGDNEMKKKLEESVEEKWNTEQVRSEIMEVYQLAEENVIVRY